jgi:hypothetical protein
MVSSQGSEGVRLLGLHVQFVAKHFIQILRDKISEAYQGAIMLEPHFMIDFQRHYFQQLG